MAEAVRVFLRVNVEHEYYHSFMGDVDDLEDIGAAFNHLLLVMDVVRVGWGSSASTRNSEHSSDSSAVFPNRLIYVAAKTLLHLGLRLCEQRRQLDDLGSVSRWEDSQVVLDFREDGVTRLVLQGHMKQNRALLKTRLID